MGNAKERQEVSTFQLAHRTETVKVAIDLGPVLRKCQQLPAIAKSFQQLSAIAKGCQSLPIDRYQPTTSKTLRSSRK
jgi:hypothetical protein